MSTMPGAPPTAAVEVAGRVDERLGDLLDAEQRRWLAERPDLADPVEVLARFLAHGGKRLRPAFCYWAYVGAGGEPGAAEVIDACAALELLHAFALIHDDVMDGSTRRRGEDTVHVHYQRRHRELGWHGESRRFGEGMAVLVGDLAISYADSLLAGARPGVAHVYGELKLEMVMGQCLDLLGAARGGLDIASARQVALLKSGKYTVERPLHLGAALAGRLDELAEPLSAYGLPLGEAFQLRDDLLGAFGDEVDTGKPVGDDFREGKPTALVALALEHAHRQGDLVSQSSLSRLGHEDLSSAEIEAIRAAVERTGARADVEEMVNKLVKDSCDALAGVPVTAEASAALSELAHFVGGRTA